MNDAPRPVLARESVTLRECTPLIEPCGDKELRELASQKVLRQIECAQHQVTASPWAQIEALLMKYAAEAGIDARLLRFGAVPQHLEGDISVSFYAFPPAQQEQAASTFVATLHNRNDEITEIRKVGSFVNVSLRSDALLKRLVECLVASGTDFGCNALLAGKRVLVDYSSPNMGKSLHVGHLGTTLVGQALANILEANGATVFRINHLGDWGTPVGMLYVAQRLWGTEPRFRTLVDTPSHYYSALYREFRAKAEEDPELQRMAKEAFSALEQHDPALRAFWQTVRSRSIAELEAIYRRLSISFDAYIGEAYYEPNLPMVLDLLGKHPEAERDGLCTVLKFSDTRLGTALLQKSDGATTYLTRDIAAAVKRKALFEPDRCLYVIGSEQAQHMRQLFAAAEYLGVTQPGQLTHVPIGLITQKGAKISSREGGVFALEEYLDTVIARAREKVSEGSVPPEKIDEVAVQVGIGAVYYRQLSTLPGKSCEFELEKILDFNGKSGPYIQYAAARIGRVLERAEFVRPLSNAGSMSANFEKPLHELVRMTCRYPDAVQHAATTLSAHPLTGYLFDLAQAANRVYQGTHLIGASAAEREQLGSAFWAARKVLINGLGLLNIQVPSRM